jgi:hypothetical protein
MSRSKRSPTAISRYPNRASWGARLTVCPADDAAGADDVVPRPGLECLHGVSRSSSGFPQVAGWRFPQVTVTRTQSKQQLGARGEDLDLAATGRFVGPLTRRTPMPLNPPPVGPDCRGGGRHWCWAAAPGGLAARQSGSPRSRPADPGGDGHVVEAGQLDWWVNERREWWGRVRGADGRQRWREHLIFVPRAAHRHDLFLRILCAGVRVDSPAPV